MHVLNADLPLRRLTSRVVQIASGDSPASETRRRLRANATVECHQHQSKEKYRRRSEMSCSHACVPFSLCSFLSLLIATCLVRSSTFACSNRARHDRDDGSAARRQRVNACETVFCGSSSNDESRTECQQAHADRSWPLRMRCVQKRTCCGLCDGAHSAAHSVHRQTVGRSKNEPDDVEGIANQLPW
jgi:hypothetical protein